MTDLSGKRALVTGGTSGLGLATVQHLAALGATVFATGSSEKSVAAARAQVPNVTFLVSDAADLAAHAALAETVSQDGKLDILFANAGIGTFIPLEVLDESAYDRMMAINVKGPLFLVKALLPHLANPASVILTASVNGHIGMANSSVYGATKAAVSSMARTLSAELIGRGIRVNAISPGPFETPIFDKFGAPPEETKQIKAGITSLVPAGRMGHPEELAALVAYLASDAGRFVVGSDFVIDGGMISV